MRRGEGGGHRGSNDISYYDPPLNLPLMRGRKGIPMPIFVSGSIARDVIMDFPGRFRDYIDPKRIHVLSLSFAVENLKENFGGAAANICYNLALLGERPAILGRLGREGLEIKKYLQKQGIDTNGIVISESRRTATAYIITDRDDNQIAGFHAGAMNESVKFPKVNKGDWGIIAAENPRNMIKLAKYYAARGVNYIFDPGQAITALSKQDLIAGIKGAKVLIGNDYEIGLIARKIPAIKKVLTVRAQSRTFQARNYEFSFSTGSKTKFSGIIVRTLGPKGSEIYCDRKKIQIGIAKPRRVVDPTGAGDAYRAGFLKGLILGYNLKECGRLGAAVASFAVEKYGTQNHRFTWKEILKRSHEI